MFDANQKILNQLFLCHFFEVDKKQYHNVDFIQNSKFHDRFLIIDRKVLYHSGASFKDLGKKCFALNKIEDKNILNGLLSKLFI